HRTRPTVGLVDPLRQRYEGTKIRTRRPQRDALAPELEASHRSLPVGTGHVREREAVSCRLRALHDARVVGVRGTDRIGDRLHLALQARLEAALGLRQLPG